MLALDGGGIRGLITIEILGRLEALLRDAYGDQDLVLADYFDYVGGTSTGAIIATGIARGMTVDKIRTFYLEGGRVMLKPAAFLTRFLYHRNVATGLTAALKAELGESTLLGDPAMRSLLLLVMRNEDTDSPWPLSNNPSSRCGNWFARAPPHRRTSRPKRFRSGKTSLSSWTARSPCTTIRHSCST
jgi:predicted acylesterase/phospholipase RssA